MNREELRDFIRNQQPNICQVMAIKDDDLKADELFKDLGTDKESPTVKELAEIMGSSHQNVKQILLKLEKKGFVRITADEKDKRKQRIELTEYCREFCRKNESMTDSFMKKLFVGVSEEQLQVTIQTIIQIEDNLKKFRDYE